MSCVYFIQCGSTGAIKIGISRNPWRRITKMQSDCPGELSLLATLAGGRDEEEALHTRFAEARIRGEWYSPTAELLDLVGSLPTPARPGKVKTAANSPTLLAAAVGISIAHASNILAGHTKPRVPLALRIYDATGLLLGALAKLSPDQIDIARTLYSPRKAA